MAYLFSPSIGKFDCSITKLLIESNRDVIKLYSWEKNWFEGGEVHSVIKFSCIFSMNEQIFQALRAHSPVILYTDDNKTYSFIVTSISHSFEIGNQDIIHIEGNIVNTSKSNEENKFVYQSRLQRIEE